MKHKKAMSIKHWHERDRPREKLIAKGTKELTDAELLSILLGSGSRSETALSLSRRILNATDHNLDKLGKLTIADLQQFAGVGCAKAAVIRAAFEIGKRRNGSKSTKKTKITSSKDVWELLWPVIGDLEHEEFWIVYLNNSNRVLDHTQLSKGGITGTLVDVRLVFKNALQKGAVAIILAHNHPSGTLEPSSADKELTIKMKQAGDGLDIKVLDHLIITEKSYFSFADEKLL